MGRGFTSGEQESGSVFSAAVCKILVSKRYIKSLLLVTKDTSLKVKVCCTAVILTMHLPSGSKTLNWHLETIYILCILMTVRARLQLALFPGLFEPGNEARLQQESSLSWEVSRRQHFLNIWPMKTVGGDSHRCCVHTVELLQPKIASYVHTCTCTHLQPCVVCSNDGVTVILSSRTWLISNVQLHCSRWYSGELMSVCKCRVSTDF